MRLSNRVLAVVAASLLAADLGLALFWHPLPAPHERELPPVPAGGDFQLDTLTGPVKLQEQRGKVVVLSFGYTFCPDICPTSLLATAAGLKALGPAERTRVQAIFVSVDPQRDTLRQLADYVRFFHPQIIGATGTPEQLAELTARYGARYSIQKPDASGNYVVDHTALSYLVAPDGRLAGSLPHGATPEQFVAAVRALLPPSTPGEPQ